MKTRTGRLPIGFRRGWSSWNQDLAGVIAFAKANEFELIDIGGNAVEIGQQIRDAGLGVGTADLKSWHALISKNVDERKQAIEENIEYTTACAALGINKFFVVMLPRDASLSRSENFDLMVEAYAELLPELEKIGAKVVIEGWPGPGALCCTPESYRLAFEALKSPSVGVNFDPSHLIRMGIDPLRFASEFAGRIYHVHGKDCIVNAEAIYNFGTEIGTTKAASVDFGGPTWRYTIPGHGQTDWPGLFALLQAKGYQGGVCIELEDANFNGDDAREQYSLQISRDMLASF